MANQDIPARWSVDVSQFFPVSDEIKRATANDNVNPRALIACESFGNTLVMSQKAIRDIEKTVLPTPPPVRIGFFDGEVGFPQHDCATQLGSTQAGLRFLGLAAALILTTGTVQSTKVLSAILEATTGSPQFLPTPLEISGLISSLEGRCNSVSFSDLVHSYDRDIQKENPNPRSFLHDGICVPSADAMKTPLNIFREIQLLGPNVMMMKVSIETDVCGPWVAAFAHWCLGTSPAISWENGTFFVLFKNSRVLFILSESPTLKISKEVYNDIERGYTKELVHEGGDQTWHSSLVSFECLRHRILQSLGPLEVVRRAVVEQLPLSIHQMWLSWTCMENQERCMNSPEPCTLPFPEAHVVLETASEVLGVDVGLGFPDTIGVGDTFAHRSSHFFRSIRQWARDPNNPSGGLWPGFAGDDYGSGGWLETASPDSSHSDKSFGWDEGAGLDELDLNLLKEFYELLSRLSITILLLSLYEDRKNIRFSSRLRPYPILHAKAMEILTGEYEYPIPGVLSILQSALTLVGRDEGAIFESWVTENNKGQVFWPSIYDNLSLRRHGSISLASARGRLTHQGATYTRVESQTPLYPYKHHVPGPLETLNGIVLPQNMSPGLRVVWNIVRGSQPLLVAVGLSHYGVPVRILLNPNALLLGLEQVVLVNCNHDQRLPFTPNEPHVPVQYCQVKDKRLAFMPRQHEICFRLHKLKDTLLTFDQPFLNSFSKENPESRFIIPIDNRDEQLQLFCTGFSMKAAVRQNACCKCTLEICHYTLLAIF